MREAQVDERRLSVSFIYDHVGRLDIPVNYPQLVKGMESISDLFDQRHHAAGRVPT